jgi:hypothetical protein
MNIWLNGTFEVPILCESIGRRCMCRMVTQIRYLGVGGARWSSGRHGWIVFCVHPSYFNLEYLSHLKFILIPLWRGFYFSEDILSNLHTVDVAYRRTKPWWYRRTHGRSPLPDILRLNSFWSKKLVSLDKIKDMIPLPLDDWVNYRNQILNVVEGQFLTKRNSNAKWREGGFGREFYGSR